MMFIVRGGLAAPAAPEVAVKLSRPTPAIVPNATGRTDFFCVGEAAAMSALRETGRDVIELRDGYYEDGKGGGVAIWGQGRYWEIRTDAFTVVDAVSPADEAQSVREGEHVEVRRAIFGASQ